MYKFTLLFIVVLGLLLKTTSLVPLVALAIIAVYYRNNPPLPFRVVQGLCLVVIAVMASGSPVAAIAVVGLAGTILLDFNLEKQTTVYG